MTTGLWGVIVPELTDVTNLVNRPSVETTDMTGYVAVGGTLAISSAKSRRGYQSLLIQPTTANSDGMYFDSVALTIGTAYAFSFDFWGADGAAYMAYFADTAGNKQTAGPTTWLGSGQWERKSHLYSATATANFRMYWTKNSDASSDPFYIDGVQVTATAYDVSYIDGDQEDCIWNGTPQLSTSYRKANSRAGGRLVNFSNYNFYLSEWPGAGLPEITPLSSALGLLPGSMDQGEKVEQREFALVGDVIGSSLPNLHHSRTVLFDALKNKLAKGNQQFYLQYTGANSIRPIRIRCKYIGGGGFGKIQGFAERIAIKMLANDPYWYEDGEEGTSLTLYASDSDAAYAVKRTGGVWSAVNSALNSSVRSFARGVDGKIYIGGTFTGVTGSTSGDYMAVFSSASSTAAASVDNGMNSYVFALAAAPDGDIYAGGNFTLAGGRANTVRIARYDGTQWQPLSTGIGSGTVRALAFDKSGNLYIGGDFTNHGDGNGDSITKWNGSAFSSLGSGLNALVNTLALGPDGYMYAGGSFTASGGTTLNGVAKWNGSAWSALGSGIAGGSAIIYAMAFDRAGRLYVAGNFTSAGGVTVSNVAMWNGSSWAALGDGFSSSVYSLTIDNDGRVYAGGNFTDAGLVTDERIAVWNGSTWSPINIELPGINTVIYSIFFVPENDMFIGYDQSGTANFAFVNTATNSGTAAAYPAIVVKRTDAADTDSAVIEFLQNDTLEKTLWMNYPLSCGETLTIDTSLGKRSVTSSFFGNVIGRALLRNSDFADFCLGTGANSISAFVNTTGAATCTGYETHKICHLSLDDSST